MKQYIELLETIREKGTYKPAARENMPGTQSLFGYQFRHNLADGFPLLTTKKISFKNVVTELLWFLRGDTNIKFLIDNGCNIWNEDAYNYYKKIASKNTDDSWNNIYVGIQEGKRVEKFETLKVESYSMFTFEEFVDAIKNNNRVRLFEAYSAHNYTLGNCGFQYGRVWRKWGECNIPSGVLKVNTETFSHDQLQKIREDWSKVCCRSLPVIIDSSDFEVITLNRQIDQIKNLINGLKNNPESRRHIVTAIDPVHDQDLALYWCHAMFQFNCRPFRDINERSRWADNNGFNTLGNNGKFHGDHLDDIGVPRYYLDCQLYQRSADSILGVPYNIASYALLTHIIAKVCNMVPGEYIHTFGDVHIYDNHKEAVEIQLQRVPKELPILKFAKNIEGDLSKYDFLTEVLPLITPNDFTLESYNPDPKIDAELSTGLKK